MTAAGIGGPAAAWRTLLRLASGHHALALADQAAVSGANFLTIVLIACATNPVELGTFAVGNSLLGVALAIQHALVMSPYLVQRHRANNAGEQAFASLVQSGFVSAAGAVLFGIAALTLTALGATRE